MAWQDDYVSPLRVVSEHDGALDLESMDLALYKRTRDPSLPKALPGRKLTWFVLRALDFPDRCSCDTASAPEQKFRFACQFALERVELADGTALAPTGELPGRERPFWTEGPRGDMQTLFRAVGMPTIYEMGIIAYSRTDWGNGWARDAGSFPAPRA